MHPRFYPMLLVSFFILFLNLAQANEASSAMSSVADLFVKGQLEQTKPFNLSGKEKLIVKIILSEIGKKKSIQVEEIKNKIVELQSKIQVSQKEFASFSEYLDYEKNLWPESGDLATDLVRIEKVGLQVVEPIFKDEESRKEWEVNEKNKLEFMSRLGVGTFSFTRLMFSQGNDWLDSKKIESFISSYNSKIVESLQGMFAEGGDGFVKEAFPVLISEYFQKSSVTMKMNMMSGLLDEAFPYGQKVLINSLFSNCGPNLQKMVQLLGRDKGIDDKWKEFFQSFESEVRAVPFWQVQELLARAKFPFEIIEFNQEPLGVGTIAQTHLAKVRLKDGSVVERVIRFIKPGVYQKALEEKDIILEATRVIDNYPAFKDKNFPKLTKMADNVFYMIVDDMNLKKAMKKQRIALEVYTRYDVYVPEIWLSMEQDPVFMIQSKAEGKKLSKYSLAIQKKVLNRIIQFWLEEAMFGSGYFHSDLHQGNFLIKQRPSKTGDNRELKSILDYGMFGRLKPSDRTNLIGLFLALKAKNSRALTNISWSLSNKKENEISKRELLKALNSKYGKDSEEAFSLENMLKYFSEIKLELNQNILEFLRGAIALSSQLKEVDSKNTLLTNAVEVALKHPLQAMRVYKINDISIEDVLKVALDHAVEKKPKKISKDKIAVKNKCLSEYQ